ncbi:MAG: ATP-binding cassette domain-containing protein, partial [Cobetia crustatorum]
MTAIVHMDKINKHFGNLHVLKDVELDVAAGEVVVIIGASGSGKSTLIRCVNGLEAFQDGRIEVDGHALAAHGKSHNALKAVRTEVGMVFQQFNLFPHMNVRDNVSL